MQLGEKRAIQAQRKAGAVRDETHAAGHLREKWAKKAMTSAEKPKKARENAAGVPKSAKSEARPSQSALGAALRANLRRRKDQARARADENDESGKQRRPGAASDGAE